MPENKITQSYENAIKPGTQMKMVERIEIINKYIEFLKSNGETTKAEYIEEKHKQLLIRLPFYQEEELKKSKEYEASVTLENAINKMCFDSKKFAECIQFMHPTLQQKFFRLIKDSIIFMANPKRRVDGRNIASKEICQKILKVAENAHVPFI